MVTGMSVEVSRICYTLCPVTQQSENLLETILRDAGMTKK